MFRPMIAAMLFLAGLSFSHPARADDPAAIEAVILSQIDAFRADDFDTAFTFASPNIRRIFRTPDRFGQMVREGYPMVWRPASVQFAPLIEAPDGWVQRVLFTDADGRLHIARYQMIRDGGAWRIDGVALERDAQQGV
ncbi:DUF4864 domain-containing protein [Oceanomicrobium pacificus]|uniref:DUF4864 domain-containing protein n=1 Tax=Oceanomicrobium pacificus TaxID=2692916 RepID=A0A6B0TPM9_9RHOB|nr:DUF4864 domain-containing protein [Oceanomicrobium pacificus]MXU64609.1 DUF4864 domain-containing protein [Oceanomicrobium pacificus]